MRSVLDSLQAGWDTLILAPDARCLRPHRFDKNKGISPRHICVPAYLGITIFCAVLSTLFAVAVDMADPWDGVGADDLHFLLDSELEEATRARIHDFNEHTGEVDFAWTARAAPSPAVRRPLQLRRMTSIALGRVRMTAGDVEHAAPAEEGSAAAAAAAEENERATLLTF